MTFRRLVVTWYLKRRLIEFETDVGGPQCKEMFRPVALVLMPAKAGRLHTTDHRYQQVMYL